MGSRKQNFGEQVKEKCFLLLRILQTFEYSYLEKRTKGYGSAYKCLRFADLASVKSIVKTICNIYILKIEITMSKRSMESTKHLNNSMVYKVIKIRIYYECPFVLKIWKCGNIYFLR